MNPSQNPTHEGPFEGENPNSDMGYASPFEGENENTNDERDQSELEVEVNVELDPAYDPNYPPFIKWTKDHPKTQIIGESSEGFLTRS